MDLRVEDVDACYGAMQVLASINFAAARGEFLGVIGPNGSGKTTLLRTITRILHPTKGAILIDGRSIYSLGTREFSRRFALVPQDTAINFEFSALDIVLMGRNPYLNRWEIEGHRDIEIAKRCMELTNCWHLADRPITELSGGEKQLVVIARALTQEPDVLLLDEPTSHLDINYQIAIMDLLKRLTTQKRLIVIAVIHDLNLAALYCDRLLLLHRGKIVAIGTPDQVLTPDNIKATFGADVIVSKHVITNHCHISPVPASVTLQNVENDHATIHLICGGGTGAPLMHLLSVKGYKVTAGVLNMLDTDYEMAQLLRLRVVREAPFSPIGEKAFRELLSLIRGVDVVIVCDTPIGMGNLMNLKAATAASEMDKPVFIFDGIEKRDFTGGEATRLFHTLEDRGAIPVSDTRELLVKLRDIIDQR